MSDTLQAKIMAWCKLHSLTINHDAATGHWTVIWSGGTVEGTDLWSALSGAMEVDGGENLP